MPKLTADQLATIKKQFEFETFCPQCGPRPRIDEDGCCATCGCDATGQGADELHALVYSMLAHIDAQAAEIAALKAEITKMLFSPESRWKYKKKEGAET